MCHTGGVVTGRKAYDRSASNFAILQSFYIHLAIDLLYKHLLVVKHYTAMAIPGKSPGRSSVRVRSPSGYQIWQGESQENHIFYKRLSICNAMVDYRMALAMLLHVTRLFLRACPLQVLLWFAPLIDHRLPASNWSITIVIQLNCLNCKLSWIKLVSM